MIPLKLTSKENVNQKPKYYIYFIRIGEPEKRLFNVRIVREGVGFGEAGIDASVVYEGKEVRVEF